jgi:ribosomal protein S18 acetylase RimI-like enzyme
VKVELMDGVTDEVLAAFQRLTPQLNPTVSPPGEQELREILDAGCTQIFLARDDEGIIVGTLALAVFRTPNGVHAWIEDVVVDEYARGQGIGEALSHAALAFAKGRDVHDVNLTSRPERAAANRLYQRLGFKLRKTNLYRIYIEELKPE